jgi:hypothetical protein
MHSGILIVIKVERLQIIAIFPLFPPISIYNAPLKRVIMLTTTTILDALFDKKASNIFNSVGSSSQLNTEFLITKLKLTRKQYYSRMSRLTNAGLVKRLNGRYLLTEFGKVIYFVHADLEALVEKSLDNYWKLKAIDALEISSKEQRNDIVCALIDDQEIRSILMREEPPSSLTKSKHEVKQEPLVYPSI